MTSKKIIVRTSNLKEAAIEFVDIWHKVEQGQAPAPVEKISFQVRPTSSATTLANPLYF